MVCFAKNCRSVRGLVYNPAYFLFVYLDGVKVTVKPSGAVETQLHHEGNWTTNVYFSRGQATLSADIISSSDEKVNAGRRAFVPGTMSSAGCAEQKCFVVGGHIPVNCNLSGCCGPELCGGNESFVGGEGGGGGLQ
jgi:hypothetical protein